MSAMTLFTPDLTSTSTVNILTSMTDNSATIPAQHNSGAMIDQSSWWYIVIAGGATFINYNSAALNDGSCALIPQGMLSLPVRIVPGTVVHALGTSVQGQVSLVRARVGQ